MTTVIAVGEKIAGGHTASGTGRSLAGPNQALK